MPPDQESVSLLIIAERDLEAARKLLPDLPHDASFHVGQAAEKVVKAVLKQEGADFKRTSHDIGQIVEALPDDHLWEADLASFDKFSSYNTRFRYPGPTGNIQPSPDVEELKNNIKEIALIIPEVREWLNEQE